MGRCRYIICVTLVCGLLPVDWALAAEIVRVDEGDFSVDGQLVIVRLRNSGQLIPEAGWRLALFADERPRGWFDWHSNSEDAAVFARTHAATPEEGTAISGAWLVSPRLVASLIDRWPADGQLTARIAGLGPGLRTAWLDAGSDAGVVVGDTWIALLGGQPVARLHVLVTTGPGAFCNAVPLTRAPRIFPGQSVTMWPAPGERRAGRASSHVSFVDETDSSVTAWIAAPPGIEAATDINVDFRHDGRYVAHGLVSHSDTRFWYVRVFAPSTEGHPPATQPTTVPTTAPSTQPDDAGVRSALPQVGDTAVIRTMADIAAGRFETRIFESAAGEFLVNAGQREGLRVGEVGTVSRGGEHIGGAAVLRVQRVYARVAAESGATLRAGDEVRFAPPVSPPAVLGQITDVADGALFSAVCEVDAPAAGAVVSIWEDQQPVAVGVILCARADVVLGFAPRVALTRRLVPGMLLVRSEATHD